MLNYIDILQKIGLDEKEALVYNASLRIGKATADQLAKEAAILRTTTYHQIGTLIERGLMSSFVVGKKTFYIAAAPTELAALLEKREVALTSHKMELQQVLPELLSIYSKQGDRPVVRFFPSKDGLTAMRDIVLQMEGRELLIVSTYDKFLDVFNQTERDLFSKRRTAAGISTRVLYTENPLLSKKHPYIPKRYAPKNVRILPKTDANLGFDIYIFDQSICFSSLEADCWGVMISGKAVAESIKVLYEVAWCASTPLFE